MKKIHGITATPDGMYVRVTATKGTSGWKILHKNRWDIGDILRNSLLMNSHLMLGLECHWIRKLPPDSERLVTSFESSFISPCISTSQCSLHTQMLEKNLDGIYPEDAYLCTLPLYLLEKTEKSFISIYKDENIIRIGIIVQRKLNAVFSLPSLLFAQLNGFLERIRRYWTKVTSDSYFPTVVYTFNNQDLDPGAPFIVRTINLPVTEPAEIKSLGVALCALGPTVPILSGPTEASRNVGKRSAVYFLSTILLLLTFSITGYIYYQNYIVKKRLIQCEIDYKNILDNNVEIRELTRSGESLAKKLLRIEKFAASPTRWSKFLDLIGTERPKKLYFDRLGSEAKETNSQNIKIAISGWADSETSVTDLIQKMNTSTFISNVTLSSLERDKNHNNTRFKILCNVQLSEN